MARALARPVLSVPAVHTKEFKMKRLTLSLLSITCLASGCVADATSEPAIADDVEPPVEHVLPLIDGAVHELGRDTGRVDAEQIRFANERTSIAATDVLGELPLQQFASVDVGVDELDDGWRLTVTPGLRVARQSRGGSYCIQWVLVGTKMVCVAYGQY